MNKFYLSFCLIGIVVFLFWGYVTPITCPGILIDSFSHRLIVSSPFITLVFCYLIFRNLNIELIAYFGILLVTADYSYLVAVNKNMVHSTGLYVVLTACLAVINKRWFLWLYSISFSLYCIYWILVSDVFVERAHWGNMLTLILLAAFFGIWRIRGLEQLQSEYKQNLDKSKQLEELNNIATQAAHDIRSPVMALENFISSFDDIDSKKLKIVSDSAKRINGIADFLMNEYRKTFTNQIEVSESKNAFDEQTISELVESLKEEKILLQSNFRKYTILIHGNIEYKIKDPKLQFELKRVLSNIINNSIEAFEDSSGVIDLMLSENQNSFSIQIKDNGKGIPKDIIEKLFERGVSFRKATGTGLGLAHAKEIIEKFNGRIELSSKVNLGTLVHVSISKF
ncbi:MAG: HAMP domain-containing sensor histidine kinase [Bdellovibrionota bacterium]